MPTVISNNDLYERTQMSPISTIIYTKRWKEIGHLQRRDASNNDRIALTWTPDGKRKRGRPKATWRQTVVKERGKLGWNSRNQTREVALDSMLHTVDSFLKSRVPIVFDGIVGSTHKFLGDVAPLFFHLVSKNK